MYRFTSLHTVAVFVLFIHAFAKTTSECMEPYSSAHFKSHPTDVRLQEGEDGIFSCTVSQFNAKTDSLTWYVYPNEYHSVISDYYNDRTLDKTSTIIVYDVGRKQQRFQCVLRGLYGGVLEECLSEVATMYVEYFPRPDEISCGPNPLNELREGSDLAIWCKVERGSPNVELTLILQTEGGEASVIESRAVPTGEKLFLSHKIHLTSVMHLSTLECFANSVSEFFLGQEISCPIGSLLVRHRPKVVIHQSEPLTRVDSINHGQIEFKCVATGYPEIERYDWFCSPDDYLLGCNNITSETIRVGAKDVITATNDTDIIIRCSATNPEGTTTADLSLQFTILTFDNATNHTKNSTIASDEPTAEHGNSTVRSIVISQFTSRELLLQQTIDPLDNGTGNAKDKKGQGNGDEFSMEQRHTTKYALAVKKISSEMEHSSHGVNVVVIAAVLVFGSLLVTTCLVAICVISKLKHSQRRDQSAPRCPEHSLLPKCVSCKIPSHDSCLDQSSKNIFNEDVSYEEPITSHSSPPKLPISFPVVHSKENCDRRGNHIFKKEASLDSSLSFHSSDSLTSGRSSNICSDVSVPSEYSERSGQTHSEPDQAVDLLDTTYSCTSLKHECDKAGVVRMHVIPRSMSMDRLHAQEDVNETEFATPSRPDSNI